MKLAQTTCAGIDARYIVVGRICAGIVHFLLKSQNSVKGSFKCGDENLI